MSGKAESGFKLSFPRGSLRAAVYTQTTSVSPRVIRRTATEHALEIKHQSQIRYYRNPAHERIKLALLNHHIHSDSLSGLLETLLQHPTLRLVRAKPLDLSRATSFKRPISDCTACFFSVYTLFKTDLSRWGCYQH
ncbi:hypothetical protein SRHO_G00265380 [Serrasalmus rhombeus]